MRRRGNFSGYNQAGCLCGICQLVSRTQRGSRGLRLEEEGRTAGRETADSPSARMHAASPRSTSSQRFLPSTFYSFLPPLMCSQTNHASSFFDRTSASIHFAQDGKSLLGRPSRCHGPTEFVLNAPEARPAVLGTRNIEMTAVRMHAHIEIAMDEYHLTSFYPVS